MQKMIDLVCECCGKDFSRRLTEHKRNMLKGRRVACSLKCTGKICIVTNIPNYKLGRPEQLIPNNRKDEFSPFRNLIKNMKKREKACPDRKCVSVTLNDLKELWERQGGICPYTGWKLILPTNTGQWLEYSPDRASVDRIDNSKGYIKDNIQFVALMYQSAKNSWSDSQVINFCRSVSQHNETM